jgi:hypothetical protein
MQDISADGHIAEVVFLRRRAIEDGRLGPIGGSRENTPFNEVCRSCHLLGHVLAPISPRAGPEWAWASEGRSFASELDGTAKWWDAGWAGSPAVWS